MTVIQYLDDYLILAPTRESAECGQWKVIKLLRFLGFYVSWSKITDPSTETIYLGVTIDTERMELRLPASKVQKFKDLVARHVEATWITKKNLEKLNGVLSHCAQIIQGGRIFARRCYDTYRHLILSHRDKIRISGGMKADLEWWAKFAPSFNGVRLIPFKRHPTPIWTDASLRGFGAMFGQQWLLGAWESSRESTLDMSTACNHVESPPTIMEGHEDNINVLELWAVVASLERWAPLIRNSTVDLMVDNRQVLCMLGNGASINSQCMDWLRRAFWVSMNFNVRLNPIYVKSEDNVVADALSRVFYASKVDDIALKLSKFELCCYDELIESLESRVGRPGDENVPL